MKISKKISAILLFALCFALMLGNFSMVQAVAAAKITVSTNAANAGESVTLTVSGSYQYEIAHATFTVTYDSSVLTLSSYTTPNLGQGSAYSAINTGTAGKINYAYAYPSSTATSGNFLTLTFAVNKSAAKGTSVVTISSNEIGNNVYAHTGSVVAGGVTISTPAADVDALIAAIGTVTLNSKSKIDAARAAYNALSSTQKGYVTKLSVLTAAETTYANLNNNVTITYKVDGTGGTISSTSETVNVSSGTIKGSTATANTGYTFSGWYNASGTKVSSNATYVPTSKTTATYTAKFTENQVTIKYVVEGSGGTVSSSSETVKVVTGTIKGSTATAKTNYNFDGWYDASGKKVSSSATFVPTSKTAATYYAKFSFAIIYGDVDDNGIADATDALLVLQFTVDKINFTDTQKVSADVDGDGDVSVSDALLVLHKSVDKIKKFPIEL